MKLSGLHLLLTYQCTFECDHCFVWGSPWQEGTMTLKDIQHILKQAKETETVGSIYFEGGEPFLYYGILLEGVKKASDMGFKVGIVTNGYWANDIDDAIIWLKPMAGLLNDLSISSDLFHYDDQMSKQAKNITLAAEQLGLPLGIISITQPISDEKKSNQGDSDSSIMYRGRAAKNLINRATHKSFKSFTTCPYENLREPGRLHLDPLGNLHICQGIIIGNIFQRHLKDICNDYDPDNHPITGPLLRGGPVELSSKYDLAHAEEYADECHMCYESRIKIRQDHPEFLQPDQVYGLTLEN
jgi:MoaA/NifB/PqqE/SkfB family radical SAM enzyme